VQLPSHCVSHFFSCKGGVLGIKSSKYPANDVEELDEMGVPADVFLRKADADKFGILRMPVIPTSEFQEFLAQHKAIDVEYNSRGYVVDIR